MPNQTSSFGRTARRPRSTNPGRRSCPGSVSARPKTPVGFVLVNHQSPEPGEVDSYVSWPFRREPDGSFQDMTVFGFGRKGYKELVQHVPDLKRLPARYTIAFVDQADARTARALSKRILTSGAGAER